jgi:aspartate 1-decarboxylase
MLIPFLISKISSAHVTDVNPEHSGNIEIDVEIMAKAGIREFQKVEVYDINNGKRFSTYTRAADSGSKAVVLNGAAAKLVAPGNRVSIAAYALLDERELNSLNSTFLLLNNKNDVERVINGKL